MTDFTLGVTFETVAGFSEVAGKVDAFVNQYEGRLLLSSNRHL